MSAATSLSRDKLGEIDERFSDFLRHYLSMTINPKDPAAREHGAQVAGLLPKVLIDVAGALAAGRPGRLPRAVAGPAGPAQPESAPGPGHAGRAVRGLLRGRGARGVAVRDLEHDGQAVAPVSDEAMPEPKQDRRTKARAFIDETGRRAADA